jgi:phosphoribosylformylglycinamidine cyclo-ligase
MRGNRANEETLQTVPQATRLIIARMAKKLSYKDAGLDLDLYNETMDQLPPLMRRTFTPRVIEKEGGFAGLFSLDFMDKLFAKNYRRPVLVSSTDGVGTKLKVAMMMGKHDTVGIDLVAMSVNDCLCMGAEPLFFLDYLAMPKDDPTLTRALVSGVAEGCQQADCALIGGETAILPDFYKPGEYDMAGFCVGVVERYKIVDGSATCPGDLVLGLASTGLHSNGYSLARKVAFESGGLKADSLVQELGRSVGEALLEPTRIYVQVIKDVLAHYKVKRIIRGIAHITGGGLVENVPRILPPDCEVVIRKGSWDVPPVFPWLQALGGIDDAEMYRVFNMGIGMVLIVRPYFGDHIMHQISRHGVGCWAIGEVRAGEPKATLV